MPPIVRTGRGPREGAARSRQPRSPARRARARHPQSAGGAAGGAVSAERPVHRARRFLSEALLLAALGGLVAAVLIGALAGLLPAIRAARMAPTEALRSI
ncbi:ABC transporter permease [Amycolatopsis tucumanensis]|uniref:ABC transporter permease n=1 Tax=Amycolatopsis tucumanensis TaxID=401106 RepID=A0ABP7JQF2_9PSEU|nr:ABC transporter permease [Amycolatopsis tucumanensis]MCF6428302.1 ABC transporter permease [Amycolatopsis tucumanensis]